MTVVAAVPMPAPALLPSAHREPRLASQALVRLELDGTRVTGEARYREGMGRIRDVDVAADGAVMILTDAERGKLIRLTPAN